MSALTIPLSADAEELLRRRATAQGVAVEELARAILERDAAEEKARQAAEWVARFTAWAASHPPVDHFVDDSRESIYE